MTNFEIEYGGFSVGGASGTYLLNGPYVIDRSHSRLRVVAEVVVSAGTPEGVKSAADALEVAFSRRDQTLTIYTPGGDQWDYAFGNTGLNTVASLAKTGNPETNLGASRAYTITVEADLPSEDTQGLRDLEVGVALSPSRAKTVTMRGAYTSHQGTDAVAQYVADFDAKAATILSAVGGGATFELVDENYARDRNTHICTFQRQYAQLLADQSANGRDDDAIRDHRVVFTDLSQHPGDAIQGIARMRRVTGSYACGIDIEETEDLLAVYRERVRPHMLEVFAQDFDPIVYAIEDERVSYDQTAKRLDVSVQIIYNKGTGGQAIVEMSQSVAIHENRTIDYTPVHLKGEFAAFADVGWSVRERVWNRTVVVLGSETPKGRIGMKAASGAAGLWNDAVSGQSGVDQRNEGTVTEDGWNIVSNTSQATTQWIGDFNSEGGQQFQMTTLTENVVERYHVRPETQTLPPTTQGGGF